MIRVSELTKVYGQTLAVDRVSFEVDKGQIVGFLGPNGAGKSTTLKILTCYMPPTSGGASVNGFDIFHESEQVRENLGYLPENVPLYTEMKVEEYLDFRGRLRKMSRADRRKRIDYVCDRCWLNPVRKRLISHLSKGYRQRVGLADALLHDPPVLILDEPTVGLDPTQIRESRKLIKELGGKHTIILSSHILPEVEAVCDRAIVIAAGLLFRKDFEPGQPATMRTIFDWMVWILVGIVPLLCMGLIAQEWATGTIESLMTAPVGEADVVLGKFAGSFLLFVLLLVPTLFYVLLLRIYGRPDYGPIFSGYLGILLVGALFIAIGLFCSSLTRSQIVAAVSTMAVLTVITILPWWVSGEATLKPWLRTLADQTVFRRYTDFSKGIVDIGNLVFFIATTGVFLFLTVKVLESRRWK